MILAHIKLKNTEDVIAFIVDESQEWIRIKSPVMFDIDPTNGLFAKEWMMHCVENEVTLDKRDIFFVFEASEDTVDFYTRFVNRHSKTIQEEPDNHSDLEDIYISLLESKVSTKH